MNGDGRSVSMLFFLASGPLSPANQGLVNPKPAPELSGDVRQHLPRHGWHHQPFLPAEEVAR